MIETSEEYRARLTAVGQGDGSIADIAHIALILASLDRPGVSFQKYEHHLKILALDLMGLNITSDSASHRARALAAILHERHEYSGNVDYYDDLQNANLMSVIDTRKGLPITLGILYIHLARSQGWHIEGLRFPRHFLIRLYGAYSARDGQVIIDPFNGGRILDVKDLREMTGKFSDMDPELKPEYFEAVSDRNILVRLLDNIKVRCLKVSDLGQAINVMSRLVMIAPQNIQHHYELGMMLAHVKQTGPARERLQYCLDHIEDIDQNDLIKQQVINLLQQLDQQDRENQADNILKLPEIDR